MVRRSKKDSKVHNHKTDFEVYIFLNCFCSRYVNRPDEIKCTELKPNHNRNTFQNKNAAKGLQTHLILISVLARKKEI